jgi:Protein of unknown function (DUF1493)
MRMPNVTEAELIDLIRRVIGERGPITRSTALYHDLLIMGDDAGELLQEIEKRYSVSFNEFDFGLFFPDEFVAGLMWMRWKLGWRDSSRLPITVEHLLAVVNRGEWFQPNPGTSN